MVVITIRIDEISAPDTETGSMGELIIQHETDLTTHTPVEKAAAGTLIMALSEMGLLGGAQ